jgi:hypothetical protein
MRMATALYHLFRQPKLLADELNDQGLSLLLLSLWLLLLSLLLLLLLLLLLVMLVCLCLSLFLYLCLCLCRCLCLCVCVRVCLPLSGSVTVSVSGSVSVSNCILRCRAGWAGGILQSTSRLVFDPVGSTLKAGKAVVVAGVNIQLTRGRPLLVAWY